MSEFNADQLKIFVTGRDVPCPGCGYNLRDLPGSRCPECGDELVLAIGLVEPKQAAGINGLIALAAGAGMSGLLLGYVFIRRVIFGDYFGEDRFYSITALGLIVEGTAILVWLRYWRQIRRLSTRQKWMLVAGCWALTLANLLAFAVFVK